MTFDLPPVRLVADFRASAMGIKPKSPGSVATVSGFCSIPVFCSDATHGPSMTREFACLRERGFTGLLMASAPCSNRIGPA